jgi:hypothetical protein
MERRRKGEELGELAFLQILPRPRSHSVGFFSFDRNKAIANTVYRLDVARLIGI